MTKIIPSSCVSPDARGCSLYMTQHGGFFLRKIFSGFFSGFFFRIFFRIFFSRIFFFSKYFFLKNKNLSPKQSRPYFQVREYGYIVPRIA
jgi:hypothetical protein